MLLRVNVHARSRLKVLSYLVKEQRFSFRVWGLDDAMEISKFQNKNNFWHAVKPLTFFLFPAPERFR